MTLRKSVTASLRVAPSCCEGAGPMTLRKSPQAGPMTLRTGTGKLRSSGRLPRTRLDDRHGRDRDRRQGPPARARAVADVRDVGGRALPQRSIAPSLPLSYGQVLGARAQVIKLPSHCPPRYGELRGRLGVVRRPH
jgi:hypothetical protein